MSNVPTLDEWVEQSNERVLLRENIAVTLEQMTSEPADEVQRITRILLIMFRQYWDNETSMAVTDNRILRRALENIRDSDCDDTSEGKRWCCQFSRWAFEALKEYE